ncbi:hypothetical protein OB955_14535 [Halobacteria archaeon AArc-m2/3/4]|uniref:DUF2254 domain-containing protein n=1 Tax=Natronoglomus mannanivorans TaxID=2979990 RepID=A0ABT2QG93_9EURY|nr:hypothetical protein [Halobacteria archaeon AArc-m2/3/4]
MAEVLVFTIFAAMIAVYSALPEHKQVRVRYSIDQWSIFLVSFVFFLISLLYLSKRYISESELYTEMAILGRQIPSLFAIDALQITLAFTSVLGFYLIFISEPARIRDGDAFIDELRRLTHNREYSDLSLLIEDNYNTIFHHNDDARIEVLRRVNSSDNDSLVRIWRYDLQYSDKKRGLPSINILDTDYEEFLNPALDGLIDPDHSDLIKYERSLLDTELELLLGTQYEELFEDDVASILEEAGSPAIDFDSLTTEELEELMNLDSNDEYPVNQSIDPRKPTNLEIYDILMCLIYSIIIDITNIEKEQIRRISTEVEIILLNETHCGPIAMNNPDLGVNLIPDEIEDFDKSEFVDIYIRSLHSDINSTLYQEIKNNRFGEGKRYRIEEENRLLSALFSDCNVAKDVAVYNPIADSVKENIQRQRRKDHDEYNNHQGMFKYGHDESRFRDPIFVGIRFFDIMVTESLYQHIEWHMWLYYLSTFSKRICSNFKIIDESKRNHEFPNDYAYLLKEISSILVKWIRLSHRETSEVRIGLENVAPNHENGDIIKSSIRCLVEFHKQILTCDDIPGSFKRDISYQVFKLHFDLYFSHETIANQYSEVIVLCMLERCEEYSRDSDQYRNLIMNHLHTIDSIDLLPINESSESIDELSQRFRLDDYR